MRQADEVLGFWFGELTPEQRFAKDDAVDTAIRRRFGALHEQLGRGVPADWREAPRPLLAAVIVLDQFSRNLNRGRAEAFAHDGEALALTRLALDRGVDAGMLGEEKQFLYMPLMHSEALADQQACERLMEGAGLAEATDYARRHRVIIERFGRFPHRNEALGRASTPEEIAFLKEPGSSF
jgi:uncharacterized protein (DUF924 family)